MDVTQFAQAQHLPQYAAWETAFLQTCDPWAWEEADAVEQCAAVLEWAQTFDPAGFEVAVRQLAA